jgi:hypothetical protein
MDPLSDNAASQRQEIFRSVVRQIKILVATDHAIINHSEQEGNLCNQ